MGVLNLPNYSPQHNSGAGMQLLTTLLSHALSSAAEKEKWQRENEAPREAAISEFNDRYGTNTKTVPGVPDTETGDYGFGIKKPSLESTPFPELSNVLQLEKPSLMMDRKVAPAQGIDALSELLSSNRAPIGNRAPGYDVSKPETIKTPNEQALMASTPLENVKQAIAYQQTPSLDKLFTEALKTGNQGRVSEINKAMRERRMINPIDLALSQGNLESAQKMANAKSPEKIGTVTTQEGVYEHSNKGGKGERLGSPKQGGAATTATPDELNAIVDELHNEKRGFSDFGKRGRLQAQIAQAFYKKYPNESLSEHQVNIDQQRDPTLRRSTTLITAIEKPLEDMRRVVGGLNNWNFLPANATKNYLLKKFGDQAVTDFDTYRNELVREAQRALTNQGAMAQQGVQQQLDILSASYSPKQLDSAISILKSVLGARKEANISKPYPNAIGGQPGNEAAPTKRPVPVF